MLLGVIGPHVRPFGTVSARRTVPENPFNPTMVMVEFVEAPTSTSGGGEGGRMKAFNLKMADGEWERGPVGPGIFRGEGAAVGEVPGTVSVPEPARSGVLSG